MKKITKIMIAIVVAIIISGIVITILYGLNKDISYQKSRKIEVNIPKGYEKEDISQIANEVFSNKDIQIQDMEKTNQVVSIRIKEYTSDELNNFKTKILEKYDVDQDDLSVYEIEVPETKISTLVTPYIFSVGLVTVLSIVYLALRNIKSNAGKKVLTLIISLIMVLGLYFSIIAITRIPVSEYTMPIALTVYVATLLITVGRLNKE